MQKLVVFGLIFLILLIGFYYYRNYSSKKDLKKVDTIDRSDLLTGLATQSNTFNETSGIDEHKKMTYGPVLKNTIMSLEPLRKPSDFIMFGQHVGPTGKENIPIQIIRPEANGAIGFYTQDGKYIKGVLYNLNTGEKLGTRYYEGTNINTATWTQGAMDSYNINTTIGGGMPVAIAELKNFYPNYIREGLFFIKVGNGLVSNAFYRGNVLPEYGTKKVNNNTETNNVIASERERFKNTHSAITDSPGDKDNPQLIPFMLSLVSKDPVNNRFVFEIRDFRGKVYQFNQYNRCDLFIGPRNKEARLCYHWSYDNDCVVVTPGNSPGIANDEISQVETTYGAKVTLYEHKNYGGGQTSIDENTRRSFYNDWWNDETTGYKVDYSNYLFMGPASSSNVTSQIIVEFENGKMYIKNSGGYFYNYDRGNEPGGRLRFGDAGLKQECELIPVLDPTLAESYFKASLNYLNRKDVNRQNILNSVDEKDSIAEPFCGTNIDFKDGIRKLDVGTPDSLSSNRITKAFERICACNMDLDPQGYYQQKFCSDNWIKDNYGIDDKTRYQAIRDNLKCTKPNCSFQKCILVFSEPKELSVRNTDSVNDECGGSTMCIINQKFENNGTLIGGTVKMTGTQTCGAVNDKGNGIMSQSGSELEWINITGSQQGNVDTQTSPKAGPQPIKVYSEINFTGTEKILNSGTFTSQNIGFPIKSMKVPLGFTMEFRETVNGRAATVSNTELNVLELTQYGLPSSQQQNIIVTYVPITLKLKEPQTNPITALPTEIRATSQNTEFSNLRSPNEQFKIFFNTTDGNLSIIKVSDNSTVWSVKGINKFVSGVPPPYKLVQGNDGNLVVYGNQPFPVVFSSADTPQWRRGAVRTPYITTLSNNGVLETRDGNNTVIWSSQ